MPEIGAHKTSLVQNDIKTIIIIIHRRDAEIAEVRFILFSGERPENKKAHHGSLYISALSAEIYNLHSLRSLRLCGENISVPALQFRGEE